jgi:hypothetical protein
MPQKHSRALGPDRAYWLTERLWELARDLPVRLIPLNSIHEIEQNCWFAPDKAPTLRRVADHARRIMDADLGYPIILSSDGRLMDGGHRVCKALLLGHTEIAAVRFEADPEPDYVRSGAA